MCANDGYIPGMTNFSCRVAKCARERASASGTASEGVGADNEVNIIDVLREYASREPGLLQALGDNFARGHREASGGIVRTEDFERLWGIMQTAERKSGEGAFSSPITGYSWSEICCIIDPASPPKKKRKIVGVQSNTLDGWVKQG